MFLAESAGRRRAAAGPGVPENLSQRLRPTSASPYPFTNPPFYVISHGYDMDITTSVVSLAKCHIHFISMSYPFFKKDIFGYTWDILDLKNCIWYIPGISFYVICHTAHTYPCPIHVKSLSA